MASRKKQRDEDRVIPVIQLFRQQRQTTIWHRNKDSSVYTNDGKMCASKTHVYVVLADIFKNAHIENALKQTTNIQTHKLETLVLRITENAYDKRKY